MGDARSESDDFDERLEREKLAALMELAYGAGHEINNPLANIAARAQTLLVDEAAPERRRMLVAIHRQAMRAHEMIADLMLFARPPRLERAAVDLRPLVLQVVEEQRELANERDIMLTCDVAAAIPIEADATQLGVAIAAVIKNAIEAVGQEGAVTVTAREHGTGATRTAEIVVADNGPGLSEHARRHLFDPFFSGREAGRGLGFGLSKCWRIVTDHGGHIEVRNTAPGAEFLLSLPQSPQ